MKKTILIVDDMKLNIDILTNILKANYSLMAATSGEIALKLLERRKPDLVLLDVFMDGIDGFGVLKQMKSNDSLADIPVIFVTGEHDAESEEKGFALGAADYIKKPFAPSIVEARVRCQLELKSYREGLEHIIETRTRQLAASREAIIMGMALMSETHDNVTGEHIERIKYYAGVLARKTLELYPDMLTEKLVGQIELYSPLHDVGKISISDIILKKTGLLTADEHNIMKMHAVEGARLLRKTEAFLKDTEGNDGLQVAADIAEFHHEKYDGSGYPHGLKGEQIPVSARIVAVADVYDALISARPYKRAFSHQEAVGIILNGDGKKTMPSHFDPRILKAFENCCDEFGKAR